MFFSTEHLQNVRVTIVGGGLAGCEAAYYLASRSIPVTIAEMKPKKYTPAHESPLLCELVCSNSLKSNDVYANACGLLKQEMRLVGSLTMEAAEFSAVPAGGALAVDREKFAAFVTEKLKALPNVTVVEEEIEQIPEPSENEYVFIATGPLTADSLAADVERKTGKNLHFFDASAPIVTAESVDMTQAFTQDRYDKGTGDYINCPMTKEQYYDFVENLLAAEKAMLHEFEKGEIFEGCMPIEVMASRGKDTLRYGTLKPVGLLQDGKRPYAVAQLRKENADGSALGLVGFQTNLRFPEQKRVFSMIPALKNAEFLRYGVMHRNSFIQSPVVLNNDFTFKYNERVSFIGQLTGVEGYVESAASGLFAAAYLYDKLTGNTRGTAPQETVIGSLSAYLTTPNNDFQPMNANFGILPPLPVCIKDKKERYRALAERSLSALQSWIAQGEEQPQEEQQSQATACEDAQAEN